MSTTTMGQMVLMAVGHDLLRASEQQALRRVRPQGARWAPSQETIRPQKSFKDMTSTEYEMFLDNAMRGVAF